MACQSLIGTAVNGDDAVARRRARRAPPAPSGSTWPMTADMGSPEIEAETREQLRRLGQLAALLGVRRP